MYIRSFGEVILLVPVSPPQKFSGDSVNRAIEAAAEHHRAGRSGEAMQIYRQVLSEQPNHPDALHLMGVVQGNAGRPQLAIDFIGRAIALRPAVADYHANLGQFLHQAGKLDQSIASYRRAVGIKADDAEFHNGLGVALAAARQNEQAIAEFRRAIELQNDHADAYNNLGGALLEAWRLDEAEAAVRAAIGLRPQMHAAYLHLGLVLAAKGRFQDAIDAYRSAIALKPDYAKAHAHLSLVYLLLGDFAHGWAEYEWRLEIPAAVGTRRFGRPRWDGGELAGRTILIYPEQGFGDIIQFARYIPPLADRGAKVILESAPELLRLFQGLAPTILEGQPIPPFDVHCSMLSLGYVSGTTAQSIPTPIPYLKADVQLAAEWARRFDARDDRLRVGLAWAGRKEHPNERNRSLKLMQLAPLASVAKAAFYSLQKGGPATPAADPPSGLQLTDWTNDLKDFADTAALMEQLDLIVTVDTAVAHLAGALGKPTWVLLPLVPDWRWMLERTDSPWYPTMRLFRQKSTGDWEDVMRRLVEELRRATHTRSGHS
jgi:tetratricopeptide (TPR) repeat protein